MGPSHKYIRFGKLLTLRIKQLCGRENGARQRAANIILHWVKPETAYKRISQWCIGNAIPGDLASKLSVGVFLGWVEDSYKDKEGIKKTTDYFDGTDTEGSEQEIAEYLRGANVVRRKRQRIRGVVRARKRKAQKLEERHRLREKSNE